MLQLQNTEYNFTLFTSIIKSKEPEGEIDVNQLIEIIKYGYLKDVVLKLRNTEDKDAYNTIKKTELPCVTLSGVFSERGHKYLTEHSGLIQIDIDDVEDYDTVFKKIVEDDYTYVCFRSPGGKGVKAVVKIKPSEETHLEQFYALQKYYLEKLNIVIDISCKDIARAMLLSYDPFIVCNPFSKVFEELYLPKPVDQKQDISTNTSYAIHANYTDAENTVLNLIAEVEKNKIDITNSYEKWIKVGYALGGALGENGRKYFHKLSVFHNEYDPVRCDYQYTKLLQRNSGAISIGTLIFLAQEVGVKISYNKASSFSTKENESKKQNSLTVSVAEKSLFESLRGLRQKISSREGIKAFMVFGNSTLNELIITMPETIEQLAEVKGIGPKKIAWFGQEIVDIVKNHKN